MTRLAKTLPLSAALGVSLTFIAGAAFAEECVPGEPCFEVTADCSIGYYKEHPGEWCFGYISQGPGQSDPSFPASALSEACATGAGCTVLLQQLNNQTPVLGEAIREGAKATLDACFGTAELSPCDDD